LFANRVGYFCQTTNFKTGYYITKGFTIPADGQGIMATSCIDCYSNKTKYPWCVKICPIAWWLNSHIIMRKIQVNFFEFDREISELIIQEFVSRKLIRESKLLDPF